MAMRYYIDLDAEGRMPETKTRQYYIEIGATVHFKLKGGVRVNNEATLLVNLPRTEDIEG